MANSKIRLFLDHPLGPGQSVPLNESQAHYLFGVMRRSVGDGLLVFNGREGEFAATITEAGKGKGAVEVQAQTRPQHEPADIRLLFAPLKKARTDFTVEKATELGVARITPMLTTYTNSDRVRVDRLQAHAIEAAEQCGATHVPQIDDPVRLDALLDEWEADRCLIFCDEAAQAKTGWHLPDNIGKWAICTGPEGGFSPEERNRLMRVPQICPVSLGPRILRAETASLVAISLLQAMRGDWPR